MSKRHPKFKITFFQSEPRNTLTSILINGDTVGYIEQYRLEDGSALKFYIMLLQRLIGSPYLLPVGESFNLEVEATEYLLNNLQRIHEDTPLYLAHPPADKPLKSTRSLKEWLDAF